MRHKKTVFTNGVRVISKGVAHAQSVSLGIWVNAGSRDEHEKEKGVFHLIEHMVFKGTRNRSAMQIAKDLDAIGGYSNAFTSKEQTCFYARVLEKDLHFLTELLSDIFMNSVFDEKDLELEKSVVLQEICMMEETPDEYVHVLSDQAFWEGEPIGRPILGEKETVNRLRKKDILDYVARFYSPERILIAAAGKVEHDCLVEYLRPFFEHLSNSRNDSTARQVPLITPNVSFYPKELEQVHLCLGAEASSLSGKERFAEAVFNTLLGGNMSSRLFQEVREKRGLAYSLFSCTGAYMDSGFIRVYVATDEKKVNQVLELVTTLIKGIQEGDLDSADLARTKEYLTGGILLSRENANNVMTRLARNEIVFGRFVPYKELITGLEKVTVNQVMDVSRRLFSDGRVSLTVLGPFDKDRVAVNSLDFS